MNSVSNLVWCPVTTSQLNIIQIPGRTIDAAAAGALYAGQYYHKHTGLEKTRIKRDELDAASMVASRLQRRAVKVVKKRATEVLDQVHVGNAALENVHPFE